MDFTAQGMSVTDERQEGNTGEQDRVLQLMGARCPGMSTQKHLENKRKEKKAGLQKPP